MFKNILAAIDDSACAQRALTLAIDLAVANRAKLTIARVVDPVEATAPAMDPYSSIQPYLEALVENARQLVATATATAAAAGVVAEGRVLNRSSVETLVDLARSEHADLMVLGSHGRKGLSRLIVGSGAEGVMREAPCPTLVVHAGPKMVAAAHART